METFTLAIASKNAIIDYREKNHLVKYEYSILDEVITAIDQGDLKKLEWFNQFGDAIRCITMNVYAHRKSLEFGFAEINFDQYGWFKRPEFLDKEDIIVGNPARYGEHSTIHLGRGLNHTWTFALNYNFGTAGGGSALSVYDKQFKSRESALNSALDKLKKMVTEKIGDRDTCNYKQPIILATLRDITKIQINMVQLTLF